MFAPLHSCTTQELFEKYVCNQSSHYEKYGCAVRPIYHLKLNYPLPFSVSYFNLLYSSTNQELFEKNLCNQGSHYEKCRQFPLHKGSHRRATAKLTLFTVKQR